MYIYNDVLQFTPVELLAMLNMTSVGQLNAYGYPSHLPQAT